MKKRSSPWLVALAAATFSIQPLQAAFVVEAHSSGRGFANFTGTPRSSSALSSAAGILGTSSAFGSTTGDHTYIFTYTPGVDADNYSPSVGTDFGNGVLSTGAAGGSNGTYRVFVTWPASSNINTNGTDITATGEGTNVVLNGVDQNNHPLAVNKWWQIAEFPFVAGNSYAVTSAPVELTFVSQRFQGVMWEFVPATVDPCVNTPPPGGVTGPLAADQTNVTVFGVVSNATAVAVYQGDGTNMVKIGEKTAGITEGNNTVAVTNLTKGQIVSATQTVSGQESCVLTTGAIVGGGANTRLRFALSVRQDVSLTGPVGADGGTTSSDIFFIGASNVLAGAAPGTPGVVLQPSNNWQTITFQRGSDPFNPVDPTVRWNGAGGNELQGDYGVLEAVAIAIDDLTDTGPYEIYIDNITNGTTLLQDFEGAVAGTLTYQFRQPSFSGTTDDYLLGFPDNISPNESLVVNSAADTGTKSERVRFQFNGTQPSRWVRLLTYNAAALPNPQVFLNDPISLRILLLPVGATPVAPPPPTLTATLLGTDVVLDWTGAHQLQASTAVSGTYTNVPGVITAPYTNSFAESQKFFRLVN